VERPAPTTTNKDMDRAVLASRFACLAFILTLLRKQYSRGFEHLF
jgi:hypothetical protein